ncbi:orotate phosphoribosyltransferase [Chloroflexota bacterium]
MKKEMAKRILELAREVGALLYGEFTLASGKKSTYYFDGKRLTFSPEGAYQAGKAVFDELAGLDVDAIGGVPIGGYPIVTAVSLVSHQEGKPIPSFIVRDVAKEHGTRRQFEGHFTEGSRVAIVDDVITTGGSVRRVIEAVEAAKGKVVKVIVIVDRHEGGSDQLKEAGYDFSAIIDLWSSGEATVGGSSVTAGGG